MLKHCQFAYGYATVRTPPISLDSFVSTVILERNCTLETKPLFSRWVLVWFLFEFLSSLTRPPRQNLFCVGLSPPSLQKNINIHMIKIRPGLPRVCCCTGARLRECWIFVLCALDSRQLLQGLKEQPRSRGIPPRFAKHPSMFRDPLETPKFRCLLLVWMGIYKK